MALRPEFTLNHPMYNAFLFAVVGEDENGLPVTVLSALARRDLDPWQEAARLSGLTKEAAARAMAATIATLPAGDWDASDARSIAARLIELLPGGAKSSPEAARGGRAEEPRPQLPILAWLVGTVIGIGLVLLYMLLR